VSQSNLKRLKKRRETLNLNMTISPFLLSVKIEKIRINNILKQISFGFIFVLRM